MIIPKTYKQFGRDIKVSLEPFDDLRTFNGLCSPDTGRIKLVKGLDTCHLEHVFLHEALHMMMNLMQRHDLYEDENFINVLSGLIHQMLHTGKGEI